MFLTTVGISIGIATVIVILSAGESAERAISQQLSSFGGNTIFAEISVPNSSHSSSAYNIVAGVQITSMKESDVHAVEDLPNVDIGYGMIMSKEKMTYRNTSKRGLVSGVNYTYPAVDRTKITSGRFYTVNEEKRLDRVVVLGSQLAKDLFSNEDPIDKTLKIKSVNFKVIGVMEERGMTFFFNMDEMALMPLKTFQKSILGVDYINHFIVKIHDQALADQTAEDMRVLLRKRHKTDLNDPKKDDFNVTTMNDALDLSNTIIGGVTFLLTAIAIISLIVGGVGIMNIMYVSVSERTHEIGLRKAVGARRKDILRQFLLEAVIITSIGGALGILIGIILTFIASLIAKKFGLDWYFIVSLKSILLGLFFSFAVGLVFGMYPARKASMLDPIEALRRE